MANLSFSNHDTENELSALSPAAQCLVTKALRLAFKATLDLLVCIGIVS